MVKAVVFDSDGTMLDSLGVIVAAYGHVALTHGFTAPTEAMVREQLRHAPPVGQILQTFFPEGDPATLLKTNGEYVAAHAMDAQPFEGLIATLAALRAAGLKLAVLTGGSSHVHNLLAHHEIAEYFSSVVHSERISRSKPDPEGFLLAAQECGVLPSECVMVGDSPTDIFAGKNAGAAYTFGITHGHASREDLQAADADYIVNSLSELLQQVEQLVTIEKQ